MIKNKISIKKILIIFLIIQPILDLKILYNSFTTLFRVFLIALFFLYFFIKDDNKKKYFLLLYPFLIILYFIFHHMNALNFSSLVPGNFNYSLTNEALYFCKMVSPFMLLYAILKCNITKNELFFIIKVIVTFISVIIIFSNLFVFSYGSYSDTIIKSNFLEWFNPNSTYTYQDLASKGLFEMANQVSAVLLMFLPFVMYMLAENQTKQNYIILFFNIFALLLVGTKVAVLGILVVFVYFALSYIIINKSYKKTLLLLLAPMLFYLIFLPFNPTFSRISENNKVVETVANIETSININDNHSIVSDIPSDNKSEEENKKDFILSHYNEYKINENFIMNRYPYTYDTDFWYELLTGSYNNKSDYRFLEQAMVKRVLDINNNYLDKLFGITYTRVQNIFNIEKDFIMQYYSLGIVGLLLVFAPYFIILVRWGLKQLKNKLKNLQLLQLLSCITICMMFCISYYSGNLMNGLGFTVYFIFDFVFILNLREK